MTTKKGNVNAKAETTPCQPSPIIGRPSTYSFPNSKPNRFNQETFHSEHSGFKKMVFSKFHGLELPATFDAHVHLRDGEMAELVGPTIRRGGVNQVYVMPNLVPPITTVQQCLAYRDRLRAIEPNVDYLMSLYLHESMTPEAIKEAKKAGITGVKSYPAGVTTNSSSGVLTYEPFYPIFAEMERQNLLLNLHGELPPSPKSTNTITVLSAEEAFLPTLRTLHTLFPRLRIILEHCTTAASIACVRSLGPSVAGTITAHHLSITVDDWAGDPFCFCKPVAKTPEDRDALLRAVVEGNGGKFFFGSDSAPHPAGEKRGGERIAAGVFSQPYATQLVFDALEEGVRRGVLGEGDVTGEKLEGFLGGFGRRFYGVRDERHEKIIVKNEEEEIVRVLRKEGVGVEVVPFRRGEKTWSLEWK